MCEQEHRSPVKDIYFTWHSSFPPSLPLYPIIQGVSPDMTKRFLISLPSYVRSSPVSASPSRLSLSRLSLSSAPPPSFQHYSRIINEDVESGGP